MRALLALPLSHGRRPAHLSLVRALVHQAPGGTLERPRALVVAALRAMPPRELRHLLPVTALVDAAAEAPPPLAAHARAPPPAAARDAALDGASTAYRIEAAELALVGRRIKLRGAEGTVLTYLPNNCQVAVKLDDGEVLNVWLCDEKWGLAEGAADGDTGAAADADAATDADAAADADAAPPSGEKQEGDGAAEGAAAGGPAAQPGTNCQECQRFCCHRSKYSTHPSFAPRMVSARDAPTWLRRASTRCRCWVLGSGLPVPGCPVPGSGWFRLVPT